MVSDGHRGAAASDFRLRKHDVGVPQTVRFRDVFGDRGVAERSPISPLQQRFSHFCPDPLILLQANILKQKNDPFGQFTLPFKVVVFY